MAKPLVTDELWAVVEPFVPEPPPNPKGGRPRVSNRACLTGILFVLKSGVPWEFLPREMGCGCGMTCWRRLRDWQEAGVWQKIWEAVLAKLGAAAMVDWCNVVVDSCSVRAVFGGRGPDRTPSTVARLVPSVTC
jgi:transposase